MALAGFSILPDDIASTSSVFQAYSRSAADSPSSPQFSDSAGSSAVGSILTSASAARTWFEMPRRLQFVEQQPALAVDQRGDRAGEDGRGIGKHAAPIAGMMRALAQIDIEMNPHAAAAAEEDRRAIRRQPRPVGGQKQIGLEFIAQRFADLAQIRRADLLAHLDDEFGIEAEPAAARLAHRAQRRQIDAVLALVVGGAAAIDAVAAIVVRHGSRPSRHSPTMPSTTSPWPYISTVGADGLSRYSASR